MNNKLKIGALIVGIIAFLICGTAAVVSFIGGNIVLGAFNAMLAILNLVLFIVNLVR